MPPVSRQRFRPGPARRREIGVPGQSVRVDVKPLKLEAGRLYQFTAIDETTPFRVLKIYGPSTIQSAITFIAEVREALPVAIQRIQTAPGVAVRNRLPLGHLHDLGIAHRRIPPSGPEVTGKVERSHRTDAEAFHRRARFRSRQELQRKLRDWEEWEYNYQRLHLGIGGKTPEFWIAPAPTIRRSA